MLSKFKQFGLIATALLCVQAQAADLTPFKLDPAVKSRDRNAEYKILAAHDTLVNATGSMEAARLAILRSMTGKNGRMFFMEDEGDGYVNSRFDFKGNSLWVRVEYSKEYIQIKYVDGLEDFVCENNRDGICYENHRHYYNFLKKLRGTIQRQLGVL